MTKNYYETDRAVSEYLLFHYGATEPEGPNFPARCVQEFLETERLPAQARALDLGCAVGAGAFELARHCGEVIGIDYSQQFITVANHLQKNGSFLFGIVEEGELTQPSQAVIPPEIDRQRVKFERGDAMKLHGGLGSFDVVLMANLIDRLRQPRKCLAQLPKLVKSGGQLILTSPYTWLTEYTPRRNWLGGFVRGGKRIKTIDTLREILSASFELGRRQDLPFLLREHGRKYQLGIAEATTWRRK